MITEIHIKNLDDLSRAAEEFLPLLNDYKVFAFYGGMGAGKTTFISALCHLLGVSDATGSPTFAIVNEYETSTPSLLTPSLCDSATLRLCDSIYHFDFYRIRSLAEAYDIGCEDYFYSGHPCLIEWPELIEPLLPGDTVSVRLTVNPDHSRTLQIQTPD